MHIIIKIIVVYIIYNSWEPIFWGAFLGAFFSFWFYVLGHYLPKLLHKIYLKFQTPKKLNKLYELVLLKRDSDSFFFDLIEIFAFEKLGDLLKGSVLITADRVQFESENWEIIIVNKIFESRFTIKNINNLLYCLDANHKDINIEALLGFIQYLEARCKQENIKLRINKKLEKAKKTLRMQSTRG